MQILELYIRDGIGYKGAATSTSTNNLVDANANFTSTVKVGYIVFNQTDKTSAKITAITNATTLALSDDIFTNEESYFIKSDFERLDLFDDESVTITDSLKNVKDIGKVFTPFSQQFNVPASKHNSKIFRHYEDFDIINSFDARFKVDALIKINGTDYKKGKVRLQSVSMKNNKPHAYKLVFFGDTVELKDVLADNDLSSLIFPDSLNFDYDYATVSSKFQNLSDVCFPLITHTKLMRYNNSSYVSVSPVANEKLNFRDIKPAIKVKKIIDAIETNYPEIEFTGELFNTEDYNNLYLWLHREKGFSSNADPSGSIQTLQARFQQPTDEDVTLSSGTEQRPFRVQTPLGAFGNSVNYRMVFNIQTTSSVEYTLTIRDGYNGVLVGTSGLIFSQTFTGNSTPQIDLTPSNTSGSIFSNSAVDILITSEDTLAFSSITFTFQSRAILFNGQVSSGSTSTYSVVAATSGTSNKFYINRQLPKMKIINFLTDLFKMFNLVAFKEDDKIHVIPLPDFYAQGLNYDITKYVDVSKSTVSKLLQYRNIDFSFKSKKSFLVQQSDEIQGSNFAAETYGSTEYDGGDYKIQPDFEKMMYERLSDEQNGTLTSVCQGAMLDEDFNPTIGKPLLLYIASQTTSQTFELENPSGTNDTISTYNRPSQVFVSGGAVSTSTAALNFGQEADEFFREPKGTNLFHKYYLDYIENIFNRQSRILKIDAYLPLSIILKYKLNDRFTICNKLYRINTIKTNLLNNKSSLELYTLGESAVGLENGQSSLVERPVQINVTSASSRTITLEWTAINDPTGNNLTAYDVYKDDVLVTSLSNTTTTTAITGLTSGVTYKFSVRAKYLVPDPNPDPGARAPATTLFSEDTITFGTTT